MISVVSQKATVTSTNAAVVSEEEVHVYAELLKQLIKQAKTKSRQVVASLPAAQVFHALITLPHVDDKELAHHVEAKVKKILPRPIEEMQVLHQRLPALGAKESKDIKVLVSAAPLKLIEFYTAIFREAGLELVELETEAFALERSLVGRDQATAMVVDIGAERTNFFIIDQGLPVIYRSSRIGGKDFDELLADKLGITGPSIGQVKYDLGLADGAQPWFSLFEPIVAPMIKEIQYSFDLYLHQSGNEAKQPEKIILTGGAALFPPVTALIQRAFSMRVFVGDPWARVVYQQDMKEVLDGLGARMSVAIGLALRRIVG